MQPALSKEEWLYGVTAWTLLGIVGRFHVWCLWG